MSPRPAVSATLSAAAAAREPWDVVVVGAGPAGSAAAARLAAGGLRVLVIDRRDLPRGKVCGCCLSPLALRELAAAGAVPAAAVPLTHVRLAHDGLDTSIAMPVGAVLSREALDAALLRRAIAAGSEWLPGMDVSAVESQPNAATALIHGSDCGNDEGFVPIPARIVILATGLSDRVRVVGADGPTVTRRIAPTSRIGLGTVLRPGAVPLPAGELLMTVSRGGYCGLVRLEDGRIDLAAAIDRATIAAAGHDVARAVAGIVAAVAAAGGPTLDADLLRRTSFRATPPLTRRAALAAGGRSRILRIGDAAGYVEPFTGEGIGWALASGRLVAEAILAGDGPRDPAAVAARHATSHRRFLHAQHRRCALVSGGVRRPTVVTTALVAARTFPGVARHVLPALVGSWRGGPHA